MIAGNFSTTDKSALPLLLCAYDPDPGWMKSHYAGMIDDRVASSADPMTVRNEKYM